MTRMAYDTHHSQVSHHNSIVHDHPSSPTIPKDSSKMDAQKCPALQSGQADVVEATCPVVGPVSATLPPDHPKMNEKDAGKVCSQLCACFRSGLNIDVQVCPVTNATLEQYVC